ncbi:uncharacterized protein [Amphiura filiformis]|uniref:uncharacterized protein isoform X3 n=1 Tax=Amphiura filiformis TaxID=82378 RepID=UPI003B21E665
MTYSAAALFSSVIVVILAYDIFADSTTKIGFKKLSPEEISPISQWIPQSESFQMKNCGPPFSISVTPWPIVDLNHKLRLEINFTADTYAFFISGPGKGLEIYKGHYKGNVTITNSNDEGILCLSLDAIWPPSSRKGHKVLLRL